MKLSFPAFLAMANAAVATASGLADFSAVFAMSNQEENEVIVWERSTQTGELDYLGAVPTGGSGGTIVGTFTFADTVLPNTGDPLAAMDSIRVSGRCVLAVNAGSNTVSSLKIFGPRDIRVVGVYDTNGVLPVSIAALDDLVYVLNAGVNGSFQGYRLNGDSCLMTAIGESIELAQDAAGSAGSIGDIPFGSASPSQIDFTPKGDLLVIITTNDGFQSLPPPSSGFGSLNHYKIGPDGTTSADTLTVTTVPRTLSQPFAFAFDDQDVLLLSEAFIANPVPVGPGGVSFWEETDGAYTEVADHAVIEQGLTTSLRFNPVNKCVYTTNPFPEGFISSFRPAAGRGYELIDTVAGGLSSPLDYRLSADGKYLYVHSVGLFPSSFGNGQPQMIVWEMGSDCGLTQVEKEAEGYDPAFIAPTENGPVGVAIFPDPTSRSGGEGMAPPKLKGFAEAIPNIN